MQVDFLPTFALGFALGQLYAIIWIYILLMRNR